VSLERQFDPVFTTSLALREKQIQQNYRPIIGIHKWFARRPGTVFRNLLLSEFNGSEPLDSSYWRAHQFTGVIADPFMGGGTPIYEANRLGFSVVGTDINPMAHWIVRQSLTSLDLPAFIQTAHKVCRDVETTVGRLYRTDCLECGSLVEVKYFMWVKIAECPECKREVRLFPRYLLAEAERHPKNVLVCAHCGALNEFAAIPSRKKPGICNSCNGTVAVEGVITRQQAKCDGCGANFKFQDVCSHDGPPTHRLWALEYHCQKCKPNQAGRFFKTPDLNDFKRFEEAVQLLIKSRDLPIPDEKIPSGDETDRLHRWGYSRYREMFNDRQLVGLGLLLQRILKVEISDVRHALLTVFSDFIRYQNMVCRYDTYALKCQDIFAVHGFPVSLVQCENSLLGIPRIGSGSFRHFVEKYLRAKRYCLNPFETRFDAQKKTKSFAFIKGERISAALVNEFPTNEGQQAWLLPAPALSAVLPPESLDGVFTDPPYYDNVQYAELIDFCFAWLRLGLKGEFQEFQSKTTRAHEELTGNTTTGKSLDHFTSGLSAVFCHYSAALKPGAPFVFTFHHNNYAAYIPLVVAVLDANLDCTVTLPAAAEMAASIHIAGTGSSILDSIFVCRRKSSDASLASIEDDLRSDIRMMSLAGVRVTTGDIRCLATGHVARRAINRLRPSWDTKLPLGTRISLAGECLRSISTRLSIEALTLRLVNKSASKRTEEPLAAAL
jgi:adenine-specific DNA methylase